MKSFALFTTLAKSEGKEFADTKSPLLSCVDLRSTTHGPKNDSRFHSFLLPMVFFQSLGWRNSFRSSFSLFLGNLSINGRIPSRLIMWQKSLFISGPATIYEVAFLPLCLPYFQFASSFYCRRRVSYKLSAVWFMPRRNGTEVIMSWRICSGAIIMIFMPRRH